MRRIALSVAALALAVAVPAAGAPERAKCRGAHFERAPGWAQERRMTVLVDSVLLSGERSLRRTMSCWRIDRRGKPALMLDDAERDLRRNGRRVRPLVVIGIGYNTLWERRRRNFDRWAARFDREAEQLIATLRSRGARQFVWVTLREPTAATVPPAGRRDLRLYSWYFPYVNERLRALDQRTEDLVLADWARVSRRPGLTYDSIHLNARGGRLMARTIRAAVKREARRQRGSRSVR